LNNIFFDWKDADISLMFDKKWKKNISVAQRNQNKEDNTNVCIRIYLFTKYMKIPYTDRYIKNQPSIICQNDCY